MALYKKRRDKLAYIWHSVLENAWERELSDQSIKLSIGALGRLLPLSKSSWGTSQRASYG
jgi:hypothetical protein